MEQSRDNKLSLYRFWRCSAYGFSYSNTARKGSTSQRNILRCILCRRPRESSWGISPDKSKWTDSFCFRNIFCGRWIFSYVYSLIYRLTNNHPLDKTVAKIHITSYFNRITCNTVYGHPWKTTRIPGSCICK